MEVVEDDVFFADLSQRISLLIMDDDEDPISHCPPVSFQAFSQAAQNPTTHLPAYYLEQNCRRDQTKGTGVFIPRSTQPRRKNKHARFNSSNTRFHRHSDNSSSQHSHEVAFNNTTAAINTSYNSFNHKRC